MEDLRIKHVARIINRNIVPDNTALFNQQLDGYNGRRVFVLFYTEEELKPIDESDRAYYFGGIIKHIMHSDFFIDHSSKGAHHQLMEMFWKEKLPLPNGKTIEYVPSISTFNKIQFNKHCELVKSFSAENLGIELYDRDQYYTAKRFRMS